MNSKLARQAIFYGYIEADYPAYFSGRHAKAKKVFDKMVKESLIEKGIYNNLSGLHDERLYTTMDEVETFINSTAKIDGWLA